MFLKVLHIKRSGILCLIAFLSMSLNLPEPDLQELMKHSQDQLNAAYATDLAAVPSKKTDIQLTNDGFFRFRRTLVNGKQEYFAFNFSQYEDLDYLGNVSSGFLVMKTKPESIIVQTFRDAEGDIDSMASELRIPLKHLEAKDLQQLQDCFLQIRQKIKKPQL